MPSLIYVTSIHHPNKINKLSKLFKNYIYIYIFMFIVDISKKYKLVSMEVYEMTFC